MSFIDRDTFVDIMSKKNRGKIIEVFENHALVETESYIFSNNAGGDVSIIDKYSLDGEPRIVNWYKLYHIGRALNITGIDTIEELEVFLDDVVAEIEREMKGV